MPDPIIRPDPQYIIHVAATKKTTELVTLNKITTLSPAPALVRVQDVFQFI